MGRVVRDPEEEAPLVPVEVWRERVLARVERLRTVRVRPAEAFGLVCARDIVAPRDLPGYTSSAMDGYAVRAADVAAAAQDAPVQLRVTGEVRMGREALEAVQAGTAVVVPTGGMVPPGADAVVPVELCEPGEGVVRVLRAVPADKHVRPAGEDVRAGAVLVPAGQRLRPHDIGGLAAAGIGEVEVVPAARMGILSTGDELVRPGEREPGPAQLFDANAAILSAAAAEAGAVPVDGGIVADDADALRAAIESLAPRCDIVVCSGGVSAGERDPVKRAFEDGGLEFANVAMQPGRPQACGTWAGVPVIGLPGNPVSVLVSFHVFVRPALEKFMGREGAPREVDAVLEGALEAPRTRTRFARVRVRRGEHGLVAAPEGGHQSNLIATFARADALAVVPAATRIASGEACRLIPVRELPWS